MIYQTEWLSSIKYKPTLKIGRFDISEIQIYFTESTIIDRLEVAKEAAYLYDAVLLYAKSVKKIVQEKLGDVYNGSLVIENIINQTYIR